MKIKLFYPETPSLARPEPQEPRKLPPGRYVLRIIHALICRRDCPPYRPYIKLRVAVVEAPTKYGPSLDGAVTMDWWNLPIDYDNALFPLRSFWRDVVETWQDIYDGGKDELNEKALIGKHYVADVHDMVDAWGATIPVERCTLERCVLLRNGEIAQRLDEKTP